MKKIFLAAMIVVLILAVVGVVVATCPRPKLDQIEVTWEVGRPPRPEPNEMLVVDRQYDFGEVAAYVEVWRGCHVDVCVDAFLIDGQGNYIPIPGLSCIDSLPGTTPTPTPTATPEPGEVECDWGTLYLDPDQLCNNPTPTPTGTRDWISDSGCWIDHNTGFVICSGESSTVPTATPEQASFIEDETVSDVDTSGRVFQTDAASQYMGPLSDGKCYWLPTCIYFYDVAERKGACPPSWGLEVPCKGSEAPTPTPTATPELSSYIEITEDLFLPMDFDYLPTSEDKMLIDWPHTILITDAFSQTTVIQGPATVRFSDEEATP